MTSGVSSKVPRIGKRKRRGGLYCFIWSLVVSSSSSTPAWPQLMQSDGASAGHKSTGRLGLFTRGGEGWLWWLHTSWEGMGQGVGSRRVMLVFRRYLPLPAHRASAGAGGGRGGGASGLWIWTADLCYGELRWNQSNRRHCFFPLEVGGLNTLTMTHSDPEHVVATAAALGVRYKGVHVRASQSPGLGSLCGGSQSPAPPCLLQYHHRY